MSWLLLSLLDLLWDHSLTSILSNSSDPKLLKFLEYARLFLSGAPFSPLLPNTLLQDSAQMLPSPGSLALSHQPSPSSQIGLRVRSLSFRDMLSAVPSPGVICLTSLHGCHHPKTPPSSTPTTPHHTHTRSALLSLPRRWAPRTLRPCSQWMFKNCLLNKWMD